MLLGFSYHDGLQKSFVNEYVLVLRLHHVVPLRAEAGDVAVDVDGLLVLQTLQHRVDDDESSGTTDSGAGSGRK